jgi:protein-S-isoprenylcysteine O-methyltransferase Ste14
VSATADPDVGQRQAIMSSSDDNAGVIAPPPLLYGAALAAGLALDFLVLRVPTGLPAALRFGLATICVLAAIVLIGGALTGFRQAGTPPEPWQASTAIVTDGVYGYTRNPMYVAMTLFYAAIAVAVDSLITLLIVFPLLVVVHYGVVLREERYLESKFGDAYRCYKAAVRRWV